MPAPPRRQPLHRLARLRLTVLLLALALGACSSPPRPAPPPLLRAGPGQALLLGEVHDNAAQHALRHQLLAELLTRGDRPALLLEQFDREHQAALDAARAGVDPQSASALDAAVDRLVQAAGASPGWHWPFYKPYLRLALAHGLPLLAANVSRAEARQTMRQGLAASGWRADVPADIQQGQAAAIEAGHCGQLDTRAAARLALAQVARDQFMASLVERHAARGVVLLAGNGHVRSDIGVPRWLGPAQRARTQAVGMLEAGDAGSGNFDQVLTSPAQPRPDPCAGLRMPGTGPASTSASPASALHALFDPAWDDAMRRHPG